MPHDPPLSSQQGLVAQPRGHAWADHETSVDAAIDRLTNILRVGNLAEVERFANDLGDLARTRNDARLLAVAHLGKTFVYWAWGTP